MDGNVDGLFEGTQSRAYDVISTYNENFLHPVLAALCPIVPALAAAVGCDSEVVLHDLSRLPNSIIAIGGNVTGRNPGDPMTDLLAKLIRQGQSDHVTNYRTVLPDGRVLRSSTLFIKDDHDVPIGCLCVNTDISGWMQARKLLTSRIEGQDDLMNERPTSLAQGTDSISAELPVPVSLNKYLLDGLATNALPSEELPSSHESPPNGDTEVSEFFVSSVEDLQRTMVEKAITAVGIPLHLMAKGHKIKVVQRLDESGFFLIRDSAEYLAQAIGVTRYTVYNYLNQLRVSNKFTDAEEELHDT